MLDYLLKPVLKAWTEAMREREPCISQCEHSPWRASLLALGCEASSPQKSRAFQHDVGRCSWGRDAAQREQAPSPHVIITGEKSVLDYLLKPVLKARTEAMRER
ncbi:hypothetical protein [Pseudomonas sp. Irchel s3h17]|uniref:hypothetical protein n=1 Tax=Pseudomonas sp. Irchel s3h17 TaxID=2009182 RepID=UPI000BA3C6E2|nr:hypothetical protein [Pseudomonas sp. Irchel s3h17]